jgi:hypothetical protein
MGVARPDLRMAFSWYVGLVALDSGRLADRDLRRLFLLSYASAFHYMVIVAWFYVDCRLESRTLLYSKFRLGA